MNPVTEAPKADDNDDNDDNNVADDEHGDEVLMEESIMRTDISSMAMRMDDSSSDTN